MARQKTKVQSRGNNTEEFNRNIPGNATDGEGEKIKKKKKLKDKLEENHSKGYKKMFYYANWKNLIAEIKRMGYKSNIKKVLGIMIGFGIITAAIAAVMDLKPICFFIMVLADILIVPMIIVNMYKKSYEDNRFREVSQYIEQMLYSFQNTNKVLKSLQDILPMFEHTPMEKVIRKTIEDIPALGIEEALKNFESAYDCQKIVQLNKFLVEVEQIGGDHESSIQLLLQDRQMWVDRTIEYKRERKNKQTTVNMAIVMSFVLCIFMAKILPSEINLADNIFYHISSVALYVIDLFLYYMTDNFCSASILNNLKTRKDSDIKKYYEYVLNYDSKQEFMKGIRMVPVGIMLIVGGLLINEKLLMIAGAGFTIFCLIKHKMTYKTRYKVIREEIEIQFPRWLMNVALYVQSNSVQVALYKSIPTAPLVLKPELIKLSNAIREDPATVTPYFNFMKDFDIPDITMSMKMFYSIASGIGSNVQQQVDEIIKRNNILLDKTEKIANDNNLAKMYMMFLMPQLSGGAKVLVDMVIFFSMFMSTTMGSV